MTTAGISGFGTTLTWNGTLIAELKTIEGPKMKVNQIDLTSHNSPSGFFEGVAGVGDGGEISISGNLIMGDTGQNAAITDFFAKTTRAVVLTAPGGLMTWTCNCFMTGYDPSFPFDKNLSFSGTLKVTGVPVLGYLAAPNLTALTITTATLVPTFAAGTYSYVATTTGTTYTVTPTCATATSITVNGATVVSGAASSAISTPSVGIYSLQVVTLKTGYVNTVYNITVTKTS